MTFRLLILGAGGDLSHRLLLPALAELRAAGRLPGELDLVGVTRHDQTDEAFRATVAEALEKHAPEIDAQARADVAGSLTHREADVTDAAQLGAILRDGPPTIAYLALPPALFEPAIETMAACDLPAGSRIVVEKPFGHDLASAQRLNELLRASFEEDEVFRMDHFFALPAARSLLAVRCANRLFEPAWQAEHIERVEITWDETLALEGRAGYYDEAGALRDMIQNHLLALLSLVAMDVPASLSEEEIRSARVEALRSVSSPPATATARARYGAGAIDGEPVPAYVDEDGVDPGRGTETFAQVALELRGARWAGVPFVLRSGKALGRDRHEIVVTFRRAAGEPETPPDRLRLDLDSNELAIQLSGPVATRLASTLPGENLSAYAAMLVALFEGDHAPFVRGDEAEEAWRIVQPVLDAWADDRVPLQEYPAGSDGPDS
jgi:glucose-6-phosphate 1-dehydrogenase